MTAAGIVVLVSTLLTILCSLWAGWHFGREKGIALQTAANAKAMADALARVGAAEARADFREREARERADRAGAIHQDVERQRAELLAAFSTGDIERALTAWEEKQAQLAKDIQALK